MNPAQPADQSVLPGDSVTFYATVFGAMPMTCQWFVVNGSGTNAIPNATNATFTIPLMQATNVGSYYLQISNSSGVVKSRAASLALRASTYQHITIDGAFSDWAGVPLAYTQTQDVLNVVAYKELYLANDEDFLYVRFKIYGPPTNVFTSLQNVFINADNNAGTGYATHGIGSELLLQGGNGYQEKAGVFNAGSITGLNWQAAPSGAATEFEFRVSLHATNLSDSMPVFTTNGLRITMESDAPGNVPTEWFPPSGGGVAYTFAASPSVAIANPNLPADQYAVQDQSVSFSVASAGPSPQYQWLFGGSAIPAATNATLTVLGLSLTNAGVYQVIVSNSFNSVTSRMASLTVLADTIPPSVTNISATARQIVITFSETLDPVSAARPTNYTLTGGVTVTNASVNGRTVTLTTDLPVGSTNVLTLNGVTDRNGNATRVTLQVAQTVGIIINGSFDDWAGIPPVYSGPSGTDGAADFKNIYVYNDDDYYYFRVTLWHDVPASDGFFPRRANLHFDTDNNGATGYHPDASSNFGSEFLLQSGFFYQEKGRWF